VFHPHYTAVFAKNTERVKDDAQQRMIGAALMCVWIPRRFGKSPAPMSPSRRVRPFFTLSTVLYVATAAGCSAAPSQNILGSYFPSWMICALIGLAATIVFRQVFVVAGIDRTLPAPLVVYLAIATAAAFAIWLIWLDPS
jgi:hypothetical protein